MSFGRLLAAGKSWVGGDGVGRYRMQKHIRLPKFITPQNPFKSDPGVETPVCPAVAHPATATAAAAGKPKLVHQDSRRARVEAGLRQFAVFCLDHNPFSQIGREKPSPIPRFGRSGVQGELSLDKVKVVRGDLAHADLEVVPVGTGENRATGQVWKNLTARIFGAGLR